MFKWKYLRLALTLAGVIGLTIAPGASAQEDNESPPVKAEPTGPGPNDVAIYPIMGELTSRYCEEIEEKLADFVNEGYVNIILELDTPGGDLFASKRAAATIARLSNQRVNGRKVHTIAYVPSSGSALSAGTLLAFACDELHMGENSRIGDVQPIDGRLNELPEKIQTVVRTDLTYYARKHQFPENLVKAMVTKELEVYKVYVRTETGGERMMFLLHDEIDDDSDEYTRKPERVVRRGELLTMDDPHALEYGFIDRVFSTREELLTHHKLYGYADARNTAGFSTDDPLAKQILRMSITQFFLILLGVLGFAIEAKMPGLGFPGLIGALAFVIFFAGAMWTGTASVVDVGLFIAALALLGVEAFVIPGFGVAGVAGLVLLVGSLVMALHGGGGDGGLNELRDKSLVVVLGLASSVIATLVALHYLPGGKGGPGGSGLVSHAVLDHGVTPENLDSHGYATDSPYMNRVATAVTALRPAGKVDLDGEFLDVVAVGEFIEEGTTVKITHVRGNHIQVQTHDSRSSENHRA